MSELPTFTIRELLDAGAHFGHKTMRWNPKMAPYLYGSRDGIHIIDLQQTVPLLYRALEAVRDVAKNNGRVLFVGTKRQASDIIAEAARKCGQYYVNHRWLGGMMTNWSTISQSLRTLTTLESQVESAADSASGSKLTKKELLQLNRKFGKLDLSLGGIREMGGRPDILFVVDTNKEEIAVKEAKKLGIPVIGIIDSNSNPDDITYPIPGNDDATRAIRLYCRLIADAVIAGIQQSMVAAGVDLGEIENVIAQGGIINLKEEKANATKKAASKKAGANPAKPAGNKPRTNARKAPNTKGAKDSDKEQVEASSASEDNVQQASNS